MGDITKIVFRSSWEFKFFKWCDNSSSILRFSSEPVSIPYMCPVDKRIHQYYIDCWIERVDEEGKVSRWLIEIKPERETIIPPMPKKQSATALANHISQVKRVMKNLAKFQAARNFALKQNMKFAVLRLNRTTENFEFVIWEEGAANGF